MGSGVLSQKSVNACSAGPAPGLAPRHRSAGPTVAGSRSTHILGRRTRVLRHFLRRRDGGSVARRGPSQAPCPLEFAHVPLREARVTRPPADGSGAHVPGGQGGGNVWLVQTRSGLRPAMMPANGNPSAGWGEGWCAADLGFSSGHGVARGVPAATSEKIPEAQAATVGRKATAAGAPRSGVQGSAARANRAAGPRSTCPSSTRPVVNTGVPKLRKLR